MLISSVLYSFGGWILDGFPKTRDHWEILLDNDILPDLVICLDDHLAPENYLFSRFTKFHSLSEESIGSAANEDEPKKEVNDQNGKQRLNDMFP